MVKFGKGTPLGDCYEVHARYIIDAHLDRIPDAPADLILCHGQIWSQLREDWINHCWLECTQGLPVPPGALPREVGAVMDISQGQKTFLPKVLWYNYASPRNVKRYTAERAARLMLETGHFGPWE